MAQQKAGGLPLRMSSKDNVENLQPPGEDQRLAAMLGGFGGLNLS